MMGAQTIISIQSQAAARAALENKQPLIIFPQSLTDDVQGIPSLGDFVPKGWRLAESGEFESLPDNGWHHDMPVLFVDKHGFGSPGEPALTLDAFQRAVVEIAQQAAEQDKTVGFASFEEGQFQIYVRVFVKDPEAEGDGEVPNPCPECDQDTGDALFDGDIMGGSYGTCDFCGQYVHECHRCGGDLGDSDTELCEECDEE
jgi:hypothetical protein